MTAKNNKQRGIVPDPAETSRDSQQHQQKTKEGDFRNAETSVSKASYDDDYEVRKEDEISGVEAKEEKDREDTGKS